MFFQHHSFQILAVTNKCAFTMKNIWSINSVEEFLLVQQCDMCQSVYTKAPQLLVCCHRTVTELRREMLLVGCTKVVLIKVVAVYEPQPL